MYESVTKKSDVRKVYERIAKELQCLELFVCKQFLKIAQINKYTE